MPAYARKRDICERGIIDALRAAGCSVQQLDGKGVPDLLVGYNGRTFLLECKDAHGSYKRGGRKSQSGLSETQDKWHAAWRGAAVHIVTTADEALAVLEPATHRGKDQP